MHVVVRDEQPEAALVEHAVRHRKLRRQRRVRDLSVWRWLWCPAFDADRLHGLRARRLELHVQQSLVHTSAGRERYLYSQHKRSSSVR